MPRLKRGRVLVTGATGFVAGHCIGDLLARGYDVRGTVRNLKTADTAHLRPAIDMACGEFDLAEVKRESSADIVRRMLAGEMPAIPPLNLAFTDVRDLAAVHRLALEVPEAKGNRYICSNGHLLMTGIAAILKAAYGPRGYKIATRPLPAWIGYVA
jgi:nucleoside-diphosphate-sugar epimerase